MTKWTTIIILGLPLSFLACGGGGGGSTQTTPQASPPKFSYSLSAQKIAVTAPVSGAAPVAKLTVTFSRVPDSVLFFGYKSSGNTIKELVGSGGTATAPILDVKFVPPAELGVGEHADNLALSLYSDKEGKLPVGNGPQSVEIAYSVTGAGPGVAVPSLVSLEPSDTTAGAAGFTLVANGKGFTPTSFLCWDGNPRVTTYLSDSRLSTVLTASDLAQPATVAITVSDSNGGVVSNGLNFSIKPKAASTNPKNVDNFTVTVTKQRMLISALYVSTMKKYSLTILEYSSVEYLWNCSDPTVTGLLVSSRHVTPQDGIYFSGPYSDYYSPSGTKKINRWQGGSGYLMYYIQSYDSNYHYSIDEKVVQKLIDPERTYSEWSDKPYL